MIYHNILLSIAVIAIFLVQADADQGAPLDPGQLGETISDREQPGFSVGTSAEAAADNSLDNVNVNGTWSFDLLGKPPEQIKLFLVQNKDVVTGQGVINGQNETEEATAIGSISGTKMSLTVIPLGVLNLYKLNLSLSSFSAGTYAAYMADGSSRSGKVTFAVSTNIFKPASNVAEDGPDANANADPAAAPVWASDAQNPGSSISSTTSTRMSSGGGWMSDSSGSAF